MWSHMFQLVSPENSKLRVLTQPSQTNRKTDVQGGKKDGQLSYNQYP